LIAAAVVSVTRNVVVFKCRPAVECSLVSLVIAAVVLVMRH